MVNSVVKLTRDNVASPALSVLIPTWNNLAYLKKCIESLRKNSSVPLQLVMIVNEGTDGTKEWVVAQTDISFLYSPVNLGICYALNLARELVRSEFMVYANDDMYFLPGWDTVVMQEISTRSGKNFMLSCTMVEPTVSGNPCVVVADYGQSLETFREEALLNDQENLKTGDWTGSTWPPSIVHVDVWDMVGGLSIEFSPGMYSDPDFSRKLYEAGIRDFKGLGKSLVYHFGSKSTRRVRKNKGRRTFLHKWGITSRTFTQLYLKSGTPYKGPVQDVTLSTSTKLVNRWKRMAE